MTAGRRWPPRRRSSRRGPTPRARTSGSKLTTPETGPPRRGPLPRAGAGRDTLLGAKATPSSPAARRHVMALGPPQPRGSADSACAALPQPVPHEPREAAPRLAPGPEREASVSPVRVSRRRRRPPAMWDPRAARCVAGGVEGAWGSAGARECPRPRGVVRHPFPPPRDRGLARKGRARRPGRGRCGPAELSLRGRPPGASVPPCGQTRLALQRGSRCAEPRGDGSPGSEGRARRGAVPWDGGGEASVLRPCGLPPRPTLRGRPTGIAVRFAQKRGLSLQLGRARPGSAPRPQPALLPSGALRTRYSPAAPAEGDSLAPCHCSLWGAFFCSAAYGQFLGRCVT